MGGASLLETVCVLIVARFGEGSDQTPDLATLTDLDAEVRAAFAHGQIGAGA